MYLYFDEVMCNWCGCKFLKDHGHANENRKLGHHFFCSQKCQSLYKNKQVNVICENPNCKKILVRKLNAISLHNFCSHSCAATITNARRTRTKKPKIVKPPIFRHTKETVILRIRNFVMVNKRIPVKREMWGLYHVARKLYGTWNNAIKAAGFEPNPVMFANRQIANDGHECDSLAEKMIDDYLSFVGIEHERDCPYPEGEYTADFKIENMYVEYFGLAGELAKYDELVEIKKSIASKHKMNLLEIYPKTLYKKNGLEDIFRSNFNLSILPT